MQSVTTINLNLQYPNYATTMHAVQNDKLSRKITAILYDGANAWTPPSGSLAVVRFMKPDGTKGFYDTDENRHTAVTWVGNSATIMLSEQVLTVPGNVLCQLNFYNTSEEKLTTFLWVIKVQQSVVDDETIESTDYFNVLTHQISEALAITAYPPYISETTHNWMTYNVENEQYEDSGISAQGIQGEQGAQGLSIRSVTKKSGTGAAGTTDVYNVNLSNNTVAGTFNVYNGSDGQGSPGSALPKEDGTAEVGNAIAYSREDHRHPSDTSRVPTTRKVNNKALSDDITLDASDVGAVPTTRTVNSKDLSGNVTLNASDIPNDSTVDGETVDDALDTLSDGISDEASARETAINNISELLAIIESGNVATQAITFRQFVLWNGSLYVAKQAIAVGDTLSATNLLAVSNGGLNEIQSRIDNLFVSGYEAYYTLADLTSYLSNRITGEIVIVRIASSLASSFFEAGTGKPTVCYILKASATNAYYLAVTQDNISVGNINVSNSTISALKDLAMKSDVLALNNSITFPAFLTCGIWRTGNDGTINLNFPCTSLRASTNYTTTETISFNIFLRGSTEAAGQILDAPIKGVNRITTDCIVLQIEPVEGVTANRMGFFSTRTVMTITAS